jgi:ornithine decarboxylase
VIPAIHWPREDLEGPGPETRARIASLTREGRPSWVLDVGRIGRRFEETARIAGTRSVVPLMAVKSCTDPAVLSAAAACGIGFDVSNLTEFERVRPYLRDTSPVSLTAPAIPPYEQAEVFRHLADGRIGWANWNSLDQLEQACAAAPGSRQGVRVFAPDFVDPATTEGVLRQSRFGIRRTDLPRAAEAATQRGGTLDSLHVHNGSGQNGYAWYTAAAAGLRGAAKQAGLDLRRLNLGGGLSLGSPEELPEVLDALRSGTDEVMIEPGNWWTRGSVWLVCPILEVTIGDLCHFVMIDAGAENHRRWSRPTEPVLGSADPDKPIVVCGRTCSEQDYFVQVAATPGAAVPRVGDWVVLGMSSYSLELESTFGGLAPLPRTLVPA